MGTVAARGLLVCMAVVVGCDNEVPVGPGSESPATAIVRTLCEFGVRCRLEADVASCMATSATTSRLDASIAAGRIRFDALAGAQCRSVVRSAPCTTGYLRTIQQACSNLFVGTVPVGGACTTASDCERPGVCSWEGEQNAACVPGRCVPAIRPSQGCRTDSDCTADQYCRPDFSGPATCVPKVMAGQTCDSPSACPANTSCRVGVSDARCQPLAADGESCRDRQCASLGSACDFTDQVCKPLAGLNEPCIERPCLGHLRCDDGACVLRPTLGDPCIVSTTGPDPCRRGKCTDGTCQERGCVPAPGS